MGHKFLNLITALPELFRDDWTFWCNMLQSSLEVGSYLQKYEEYVCVHLMRKIRLIRSWMHKSILEPKSVSSISFYIPISFFSISLTSVVRHLSYHFFVIRLFLQHVYVIHFLRRFLYRPPFFSAFCVVRFLDITRFMRALFWLPVRLAGIT